MAQIPYRGNLSAKVFPFLSSQFGRTVIINGQDQVNVFQGGIDSTSGDNNIPQMYYCENVVPTPQGYKSVGYSQVLPAVGVNFQRVLPVRDPDMTRGWLGVCADGAVYIYKAGDTFWTNITATTGGWLGGNVSIAYVAGYSYLCLANFNVFKIDVTNRTMAAVNLLGITESDIVAITSSSNYLVISDGITVYWSSTINPEDFVPSLITGAGSLKPTDVEGLIVALIPLSNGFAVYTSVNVVISSYSQNPRFPWIFRGADNSRGIANIEHVTFSSDDGTNYAWTSGGIQKISVSGAVTVMPEVTDFLSGKELETFNTATNEITSTYLVTPIRVKLSFIGARYLVISYGEDSLTHALIYDTSLKRWGKLKLDHVSCFEVALNTDGAVPTSAAASPKRSLGFVNSTGIVNICNFENGFRTDDAVMLLGKFQLVRSRATTLEGVVVESVDSNNTEFDMLVQTSYDGKTNDVFTVPYMSAASPKMREYKCRVTGVNHTLVLKGCFHLNAFMLTLHVNGRR